MISIENALDIILKSIKPLGPEIVPLGEAHGRVLFNDIRSDVNIPPFDNSAMDGYAVKCIDTKDASIDCPKEVILKGEIQAGDGENYEQLQNGYAYQIMTGAPIPPGADSVIPVEYTKKNENIIYLHKEVKKDENIRFAGEDMAKGNIVLEKGRRLIPADIGLLASLNNVNIEVYKKPRVAILATGDEIVELGEDLLPGKIRNSNSYSLLAEIPKYGADASYIGIARDTIEDTREIIKKCLSYDVIITTGGVSMGEYDFIKEAIEEIGVNILIEKIKMKPGKPVVFGKKDNLLFFGLPGNPVSTLVASLQFVRPALLSLMGVKQIHKPLVHAILENDIKKKTDRTHFIRAFFTIKHGSFYVNTTGPQGSGILKSMSIANCLIILPEKVSHKKKGEVVEIQLIHHEDIA